MERKMKIGIITFHFPYNCGATLQCVALQTKLEQLGNEVEVINYRPWYHQNRYVPLKNPVYYAKKMFKKKDDSDLLHKRIYRGVDGFARVVYSWRNYKTIAPRDKKFRAFIKNNIHETRVYRTLEQLQTNPPQMDMYVCGSDQLWNAKLTEGVFDPAYFLQFGEENVVRISYSMGANFDSVADVEKTLEPLLKDFWAVALRETKCHDAVRKALPQDKSVQITLDPTFLLEEKDYLPLIPEKELETEPFILTYTMPNESQHKIYNAAKIFSEKTGIKVIDVSGNPSKVNQKIEDNRICGPDEFLWYVKNASYVLTNSFHGTAFSVIFRKQFAVVPHSETGNRVSELLEKLGLGNRWTKTGTQAAQLIEMPVDYSDCEINLACLREESVAYLRHCVEHTKNEQMQRS